MARKLINLRQHRLKQLADADKKRKYGSDENDQEVGKVEGIKTNPFKKKKIRNKKEKLLLKNGATYKESTTSKSGSKEAKIGAGIYSGKG